MAGWRLFGLRPVSAGRAETRSPGPKHWSAGTSIRDTWPTAGWGGTASRRSPIPDFVPIEDEERTGYLSAESRVIGVEIDGGWLAIPHNVMYRHEIVNLNRDDTRDRGDLLPPHGVGPDL